MHCFHQLLKFHTQIHICTFSGVDFSAVRVGRNSFRITRLATDHCLGHTITVSQSEGYGRHFRYRARVRVRGCSKVRRTGRGGRRPRRFIREKVASAPATFPSSFYPGSKFGADSDFETTPPLCHKDYPARA